MSPSRLYLIILLGLTLSACNALSASLPQPGDEVMVNLPGENSQTPLEGAVIYGDVSITAQPADAQEVSFYLDDPGATGEPVLTSATFPVTLTLATRTLPDGPHSLTLRLVAQDGAASLEQLSFAVGNDAFAMLSLVNDLRADGHDCGTEGRFGSAPALRLESRLMRAAQRHADDMNTHAFMDHTGSDGSTVVSRVEDAGYNWSRVGENIASGQKTTAEVVEDWAESDGHCANLLNPGFTELGVGRAGTSWAQVFARP